MNRAQDLFQKLAFIRRKGVGSSFIHHTQFENKLGGESPAQGLIAGLSCDLHDLT
jgi:hypothetical protein